MRNRRLFWARSAQHDPAIPTLRGIRAAPGERNQCGGDKGPSRTERFVIAFASVPSDAQGCEGRPRETQAGLGKLAEAHGRLLGLTVPLNASSSSANQLINAGFPLKSEVSRHDRAVNMPHLTIRANDRIGPVVSWANGFMGQ